MHREKVTVQLVSSPMVPRPRGSHWNVGSVLVPFGTRMATTGMASSKKITAGCSISMVVRGTVLAVASKRTSDERAMLFCRDHVRFMFIPVACAVN